MSDLHPIVWFVQIFIFLLGVAVGHSIIMLKIHREENRKKELELALLEKQSDLLSQSTESVENLDDALYNARVRQEIDDIISRN